MSSGTLTMTRGDDVTLDVAVADDAGVVNLTGASLWWTAKWRHTDADENAVISKTTGAGINITDAPGGLAEITIVPADTADLTGSASMWWDLQVKDAPGHIRTLASGRLVVNADVTRATA